VLGPLLADRCIVESQDVAQFFFTKILGHGLRIEVDEILVGESVTKGLL
jgi:hypothetical protein